MSTVAKYLRISNEDLGKDKHSDSESISNQRHLLDDYLDTHSEFDGWDRIELCDDGWSGTNFERPGVQELLEHVRKGKVQCIIVKDFSRFGRNYLVAGDYISRVFPFMGVRFISLGDGYDSSRPEDIDSLSVSFSTIIYDLYSKDLSQKIRISRDRLAEQGKFLAPAAPFGYKKDPTDKHHLIIDDDAADTVRTVFDLICSGFDTVEVARHLNQMGALTPMQYKRRTGCTWLPWPCISEDNFWTRHMVVNIIRDQRYIGNNTYGKRRRDIVGSWHTVKISHENWIIAENVHEPIISREQFSKANGMLGEYRERNGHPIKKGLSQRIICGCCGHAMNHNYKKNRSYYCGTPQYTDEYGCRQDLIPETEILDAVFSTIRMYARLSLDLEELAARQLDQNKTDRKTLQRRLMVIQSQQEQTERQLQDMYESFVDGAISKAEYVSRKQSLSDRLSKLYDEAHDVSDMLDRQDTDGGSEILAVIKRYATIDELTEAHVLDILDCVTIYPDGRLDVKILFADELNSFAKSIYSQIKPA